VLIEPAQVHVDILWPDIKAAARQILAESFGRRVTFRLLERADAARAAVPPQEAGDLNVSFPRGGREPDDGPPGYACGVDCPIYPCAHIIGADDIMIDPMHCTPWFDVIHYRPPAILH